MSSPWFASLLGLLVLSAGCSRTGASTPGPDAGTLEYVGLACNVDAECGELRCDKVRRQCICLSDSSCQAESSEAPQRFCNNFTGLCVTEIVGCVRDADCVDAVGQADATQYCDAAVRACRPKKGFCQPCLQDSECGGAGDLCLLEAATNRKFCGKACADSIDCPRGAACNDVNGRKQCQPSQNPLTPGEAAICSDFRGCTPDLLRRCDSNSDCGDSGEQRCDLSVGLCVAVEQVCPFGTACDPRNRICVSECTTDSDCGDADLRCINRICEPTSECRQDSDCASNKVCSVPPGQTVGQCQPFCQTDANCPLGQLCKKGADNRYRCEAGCSSNGDCPIDTRCNLNTRQCDGPVVNSIRTCQSSVACNGCELCHPTLFQCQDARTGFPYCATCSSDSECTGGACVQLDDGLRYCARSCVSGQECPQGFVCLPIGGGASSACVPSDRQCKGKCQ